MKHEKREVDTFIENGPYASRVKQLGWRMMVLACGFQPTSRHVAAQKQGVESPDYNENTADEQTNKSVVMRPPDVLPTEDSTSRPEQLVLELQFFDQ